MALQALPVYISKDQYGTLQASNTVLVCSFPMEEMVGSQKKYKIGKTK